MYTLSKHGLTPEVISTPTRTGAPLLVRPVQRLYR
jgi:hypothetical protein